MNHFKIFQGFYVQENYFENVARPQDFAFDFQRI